MIGWPILYLRHDFAPSGVSTTTVKAHWAIANVMIGTAVQLAIVYGMQFIRRFTLRMLLLATTIAAVSIAVGRMISGGAMSLYYYIMAIYFAPVLIAVMLALTRRLSSPSQCTQRVHSG